jgi:hypothetical protein
MTDLFRTTSRAEFSACGTWRYLIEERWGAGPIVGFVLHNPSTATAEKTDHSKSRIRNFAAAWGFDGFALGNRFAGGRSPKPDDLNGMADPIGPDNDKYLAWLAANTHQIICAWGDLFCPPARTIEVVSLLRASGQPLYCLGTTKAGMPKHPAARGRQHIPRDQQPELWTPRWLT